MTGPTRGHSLAPWRRPASARGHRCWAVGGAFALWLLSAVGFQANIEPTPAVQNGLRLLMSVIPAVLACVSIGLMLGYPLKEDLVKKIGAELAARRAAAAGTGEV